MTPEENPTALTTLDSQPLRFFSAEEFAHAFPHPDSEEARHALPLKNRSGEPVCWILGWEGKPSSHEIYIELKKSLTGHIARLGAHEANGKMMGIQGLLDAWEETPPEGATLLEDSDLLREAFASLHSFLLLHSWLSDEEIREPRQIALEPIVHALTKCAQKFFHPVSQLEINLGAAPGLLAASPEAVVVGLLGTAWLLSELKAKTVSHLQFQGTDETGNLHVRIENPLFSTLLFSSSALLAEDIAGGVKAWLILFALSGGLAESSEMGVVDLWLPTEIKF